MARSPPSRGSREAIAAATTEPRERFDVIVYHVPVGKGRIVAFDFDPLHRYHTMFDFRLVWNAVLNWNDLHPVPKTK